MKLYILLGMFLFSGWSYASPHSGHKELSQQAGCADNVLTSVHCGKTPSAIFSPTGVLWVAWVDSGHVYVSHSRDAGKHYTVPVAVNRVPELIEARGENRPKIALGNRGEIFITYTVKLAKKYSGNIRFSRSLDSGNSFSEPLTVNDNLDQIGHRFDTLVVTPDNHLYVIWIDKRDSAAARKAGKKYPGASLYYSVSDDAGKSFARNQRLIQHSCECCRIAAAYDGTDVVATWRHIFGNNIRDHNIARLQDAGRAQRVSEDAWALDGCPHHGPALAVDPQGRYHVSWYTQGSNRKGLYYARSADIHAPFSAPLQLGTVERLAGHASIATLEQQVLVVWREFDGKQTHIQLAEINASGDGLLNQRVLASSSGEADYPFLLPDNGKLYLAWQTRNEGYHLHRVLP